MQQRSYHSGTIKSLYAHSGNRCAFPGCNQELVYEENVNIGEICHIYGLNPNSARYIEGMDPNYLNSEMNLILLCPTHHKIIDSKGNEGKYPVQTLLNMKSAHEKYISESLNTSIAICRIQYICDYAKIKRQLKNKYGIDCKKKDVEAVGAYFSSQHEHVRSTMKNILDIMHRNEQYKRFMECGEISMQRVLYSSGIEINTLANILKYLELCEYIREDKYPSNSVSSLIVDFDGGLIDISDNYILKIRDGKWVVTSKGMIIDAIYQEQGYL